MFLKACWVCLILTSSLVRQPFAAAAEETVSCKTENGETVDWFIAYKIPKNADSSDSAVQIGAAYFFITPASPGWKRSTKHINDADSIVGISTAPLFRNSTSKLDLASVLYNDQPPDGKAVIYNGHTKGIALASKSSALWLVHSVPHFPIPGPAFGYPIGGLENGQLFLCLTLNLTHVDKVGIALQYTKPHIFNSSIPDSFIGLLPQLNQVVNKNATKISPPWFTSFQIGTGSGELEISVFVKGPKFRKEIFADWIAPELQTGLDVQSWLNGAHPFQSNCTSTKFSVLNILSKDIDGQNFTAHNDHSKWAVGIEKSAVCISDLNRTKPQKTRGGVALCFTSKHTWSAFKEIVATTQPCNVTINNFGKYFKRTGSYG